MESLFNKVSGNKKTPAQVYSCEFCKNFKETCFIERRWWSWSLYFKKLCIVRVLKNGFEWLAANDLSSNGYT